MKVVPTQHSISFLNITDKYVNIVDEQNDNGKTAFTIFVLFSHQCYVKWLNEVPDMIISHVSKGFLHHSPQNMHTTSFLAKFITLFLSMFNKL